MLGVQCITPQRCCSCFQVAEALGAPWNAVVWLPQLCPVGGERAVVLLEEASAAPGSSHVPSMGDMAPRSVCVIPHSERSFGSWWWHIVTSSGREAVLAAPAGWNVASEGTAASLHAIPLGWVE